MRQRLQAAILFSERRCAHALRLPYSHDPGRQNWREAIGRHKEQPDDRFIRATLASYQAQGYTYLRDGGALSVPHDANTELAHLRDILGPNADAVLSAENQKILEKF